MTDLAWLPLTPTVEQRALEWEIQQKVLTLVCEGGRRRSEKQCNPQGKSRSNRISFFIFFILLTYRMIQAIDAVIRWNRCDILLFNRLIKVKSIEMTPIRIVFVKKN